MDEYKFLCLPVQQSCTQTQSVNVRGQVYRARGSTACVYDAMWRYRPVAIKILRDDRVDCKQATTDILHDMQTLLRVHHENIVELYATGVDPLPFMVMERLECTLSSRIREAKQACGAEVDMDKREKLAYAEVLRVTYDVARALHYLHTQVAPGVRVVHRDLKPDNIMFDSKGRAKLIDMGLCKWIRVSKEGEEDGYVMTGGTGSLRYMAPEVLRGERYNQSVDVYSFGVVLWEMCTLQKPHDGMSVEDYFSDANTGRQKLKVPHTWPPKIAALVRSCISHSPSERPSFAYILGVLREELTAASTLCSQRSVWTDMGRSQSWPSSRLESKDCSSDVHRSPLRNRAWSSRSLGRSELHVRTHSVAFSETEDDHSPKVLNKKRNWMSFFGRRRVAGAHPSGVASTTSACKLQHARRFFLS